MKNERQSAILDLIAQRRIATQDELVAALRQAGFAVTQATISRDIRELGLSKESDNQGYTRYIAAGKFKSLPPRNERERFTQMFVSSVLDIQYANNMIVIHTLSGAANAAATDALKEALKEGKTIYICTCSEHKWIAQLQCKTIVGIRIIVTWRQRTIVITTQTYCLCGIS